MENLLLILACVFVTFAIGYWEDKEKEEIKKEILEELKKD